MPASETFPGLPTETDVAVVGAGPTGLLLANLLALQGVRVAVLEARSTLIDYPRGIGLDDESMRSMQAAGLAESVLAHVVPNQRLRYVTAEGRILAEFAPGADDFGWPRKLGFIQPQVDRRMYEGLERFDHANVHFGRTVETFREDVDGVDVEIDTEEGQRAKLRARYLVGCDGGRSGVRKAMGVNFDGVSEPTRWLVVDLRNDPIGTPNAAVYCDPNRPYVSVGLPHGVRRFEFMLFDHEGQDPAEVEAILRRLLAEHLDEPEEADLIAYRVYAHHARVASSFRKGRLLIAGDAAHLMPVWQGQGYNTGIRDAGNLAWKLALVCQGRAAPSLLDSYDLERRPHAKSMVDLSRASGRFLGVRNKALAAVRDRVTLAAGSIRPVRDYFLQMRFKPMPTYREGAVADSPRKSPVGTLFIQPDVVVDEPTARWKLDDVLGNRLAVLRWGDDPRTCLNSTEQAFWRAHEARFAKLLPMTQFTAQRPETPQDDELLVIGDLDGRLRAWFNQNPYGVVFLRPDRIVAAACQPQRATATAAELRNRLSLLDRQRVTGSADVRSA